MKSNACRHDDIWDDGVFWFCCDCSASEPIDPDYDEGEDEDEA